jgi:hypothetical protein
MEGHPNPKLRLNHFPFFTLLVGFKKLTLLMVPELCDSWPLFELPAEIGHLSALETFALKAHKHLAVETLPAPAFWNLR